MATSEAASAAELVKKADDERLATANAGRMRRVAERGAKAAEQKAEFDLRHVVAARLKLEIDTWLFYTRGTSHAEAR